MVVAEQRVVHEVSRRLLVPGAVTLLSLTGAICAALFTGGPYYLGTGADSGWTLLWCITSAVSMLGPASACLLIRDFRALRDLEYAEVALAPLVAAAVVNTVVGAVAAVAWTRFLFW